MADLAVPAIKYKQGSRTMYVAVDDMKSVSLVLVDPTHHDIDPRHRDNVGNRRLDRQHKEGIKDYLREEEDFIIGSIICYVPPDVVKFEPMAGQEGRVRQLGTLLIPVGLQLHIGDGQHRAIAELELLKGTDPSEEVYKRIADAGQPVILVEESQGWKMSMDFMDLGHNAKPLTSSLGFALDRRQPINVLALDVAMGADVLKDTGSTSDGKAGRIEFQGNSVGKGSAKLYTFASWRFAIATYVLGWGTRNKKKITTESARILGEVGGAEFTKMKVDLVNMLDEAARKLPGWQQLIHDPKKYTARELREAVLLGTSAGLTAFMYAMREARAAGVTVDQALERLAHVNWSKEVVGSDVPFFQYTLVIDGRVQSSRTAFEPAGSDLARVAKGEDIKTVMSDRETTFMSSLPTVASASPAAASSER